MSSEFLQLPASGSSSRSWPGDILEAHKTIQDIYSSAFRLLRLDDSDPLRLGAHAHLIEDEALPLLWALSHDLPEEWVEDGEQRLKMLMLDLRTAEDVAQGV
jgi:hypothetical protein